MIWSNEHACTQLRMGLSHLVTKVLRKQVLDGLFESDIGKVRDMSEIATEHVVYAKEGTVVQFCQVDTVFLCLCLQSREYVSHSFMSTCISCIEKHSRAKTCFLVCQKLKSTILLGKQKYIFFCLGKHLQIFFHLGKHTKELI